MIAILSPAKSLDYESKHNLPDATQIRLPEDTKYLVSVAATKTVEDLKKMMHISDSIAKLNYDRFTNYEMLPERQAIAAFDGDVYTGLNAKTFTNDDVLFAQDHLRILSGLYGILRPLDAMKPYRLEMGTKRFPLENKVSHWWGNKVAEILAKDARATGQDSILNLASQEYYAVAKGRLPDDIRVVNVNFIAADGRFITMHAKVARGVMARWMIINKITNINDMREFNDGYTFDNETSTQNEWTFKAV